MNWSPSMMCVDILHLKDEMEKLDKAGCTSYHIDVMDGVYVPNITLGLNDINAMGSISTLPLEVHLMVHDPASIIKLFNLESISTLYVHPEACPHLHRTLTQIKSMGKKAGLVINPGTALSALEEVIEVVDVVMVMSVNPGYAGQAFIESSYSKVQRIKNLLVSYSRDVEILVDGAISTNNVKKLIDCGATGFVLGSAGLFKDELDYAKNLKQLQDLVQ